MRKLLNKNAVRPSHGDPIGRTPAGAGAADQASPLAPPRPHIACLDGLRGVAILMVLAIHCSQLAPGLAPPVRNLAFYGVRGVQLFFIVSGFTLAINYAGKPIRLAEFAARRFFRIAPMFYIGIVLYLVLAWTVAPALPTRDADGMEVAATILFLHGWLPHAINRVVPGGWSIAAEAMFYLCFPLLLPLVSRPRTMAAVLTASYLAAVAIHLLLRRFLPGPAGMEISLYFWAMHLPAFVGGCWVATLAITGRDAPVRRLARPLLGIAMAGMLIDSQLRHQSNLLVAVILLTLFAWAVIWTRPRLLEHPALTLIGQISFSLYIVHFAVLAAFAPCAAAIGTALGANAAFAATFLVTLVIAGALSWCSYRWIELPAMRVPRRLLSAPPDG